MKKESKATMSARTIKFEAGLNALRPFISDPKFPLNEKMQMIEDAVNHNVKSIQSQLEASQNREAALRDRLEKLEGLIDKSHRIKLATKKWLLSELHDVKLTSTEHEQKGE